MGERFLQKSFAWENKRFLTNLGGGEMFYMGTNDQIIQGASQWLMRFQGSS